MRALFNLCIAFVCVASAGLANAKDCSFKATTLALALANPTILWRGDCPNGLAEGSGAALFYTHEGTDAGVFYGTARGGEAQLGVYQYTGYSPVGTKDSLPQATQAMIAKNELDEAAAISDAAYEAAHTAALTLSAHYEKAGNRASAAYYKKAAKELEFQFQ